MNKRPTTPMGQPGQLTLQHGFTLLELLVVMTLLSVLMTGLISALRTMAQTETKIDQRLARLDEIRVARAFLQQTLTRVSAARIEEPGATGKTIVPFVASADSLVWVGILPPRPNVGGRHFFRLAIEQSGSSPELVLRFAPCNASLTFPDWSQTEARVLIQDVKGFGVQAQGQLPVGRSAVNAWLPGWQDGWSVPDVIPEQVRLSMTDGQGSWPELIVALHALPQSDSTFSVTVIGGSIR